MPDIAAIAAALNKTGRLGKLLQMSKEFIGLTPERQRLVEESKSVMPQMSGPARGELALQNMMNFGTGGIAGTLAPMKNAALLAEVRAALSKGMPREEVWGRHGGVEVPGKTGTFIAEEIPPPRSIDPYLFTPGKTFRPGNLIDNPELYKRYPELETNKIHTTGGAIGTGSINPHTGEITMGVAGPKDPTAISNLLQHEWWHKIARKEGLPEGSSDIAMQAGLQNDPVMFVPLLEHIRDAYKTSSPQHAREITALLGKYADMSLPRGEQLRVESELAAILYAHTLGEGTARMGERAQLSPFERALQMPTPKGAFYPNAGPPVEPPLPWEGFIEGGTMSGYHPVPPMK